MPIFLAIPVILRIAATLVFLIAVIAVGAMNRSVMMVPLLAAVATLVQWGVGLFAPNPLTNLKDMVNPGAAQSQTPGNTIAKLARKFLFGVIGYGILFALAYMISGIFKATEMERIITRFDLILIAVTAAIAVVLSVINAFTAANQVTGMMDDLQQAFSDMQGGQGPDQNGGETPFTVDGEIIEPKD